MNWLKGDMKKFVFIMFSLVLFYVALENIDAIWDTFGYFLSVVFPFILGAAIAFILNVPMRAIEKQLFSKSKKKTLKKMKRPVAIFITVVAVIGVLSLVVIVVAPQIMDTVTEIGKKLPDSIERNFDKLKDLVKNQSKIEHYLNGIDIDWHEVGDKLVNYVQNGAGGWVNSGISFVGSILSGVVSFFIAFVFAIYILFQKEKLASQSKQILLAFFSKKTVDKTIKLAKLSEQTFAKFLSGQCLEATILGSMFVVSMLIFRLPYALMMGIIIAITALIPIVGAFFGCFIGILLIMVDSPIKALFFVILFLVLQQIEGNLIYPHVVGNSVGLPSIWVLLAVTVGGNLFGITGMILFIPICSVAYALFKDVVKARLASKKIKESDYNQTQE